MQKMEIENQKYFQAASETYQGREKNTLKALMPI